MEESKEEQLVRLDLNDAVFQENLLNLPKSDRHSAMETLNKLRRMTWTQVYRDSGLKWEKIRSKTLPRGVAATYSLRITQSRRAVAYRDGDFIRLIAIPADHDSTYGKK